MAKSLCVLGLGSGHVVALGSPFRWGGGRHGRVTSVPLGAPQEVQLGPAGGRHGRFTLGLTRRSHDKQTNDQHKSFSRTLKYISLFLC